MSEKIKVKITNFDKVLYGCLICAIIFVLLVNVYQPTDYQGKCVTRNGTAGIVYFQDEKGVLILFKSDAPLAYRSLGVMKRDYKEVSCLFDE